MAKTKRRKEPSQATPELPLTLLLYLGEPPVLPNENVSFYWALVRNFAQTVKPKDAMEWIWICDLADLTWEIKRYRRDKTSIIWIGHHGKIDTIALSQSLEDKEHKKDDEERAEMLDEAVQSADRYITAEGFVSRIDDLERIERLIASAENRRNGIIREIALYRELVALRAREISDEFIVQNDSVPLVPASSDSTGESEVTTSEKTANDE